MIEKDLNRPWGKFFTFIKNQKCTVKLIHIQPKQRLSLQSHEKRKEYWYIIQGLIRAEIGYNIHSTKHFILHHGQEFKIEKGIIHRLANIGDQEAIILEISKGWFDENDIRRFQDDYHRK